MKYIRTKDGSILSKGKIICSAFSEEYCSPNWNEDIEKYLQTKIVAETDTIEELCDLFMADRGYKMFYARENGFRTLNDIRRYCGLEDCKFLYAYIYGEDGDIIKVAKMNDKGELELL